MRAGGLRRDAGLLRELGGGQRRPVISEASMFGAGRVADQRADEGDVGAVFHGSIIPEAWPTGNVR